MKGQEIASDLVGETLVRYGGTVELRGKVRAVFLVGKSPMALIEDEQGILREYSLVFGDWRVE